MIFMHYLLSTMEKNVSANVFHRIDVLNCWCILEKVDNRRNGHVNCDAQMHEECYCSGRLWYDENSVNQCVYEPCDCGNFE